ncbi:bifunctional riboflavin kinase/FAD synthetase [Candidatus Xianfuyuplasma coldseepsis]|uniref:Riboflavin biosynthesis protein n=1 Tax=Candidatus Xianfuyuplasma coldseepsis TaxID=2782163 RepID=A0A7L7KV38_9MOLU|nr:bifunctional riboflavin kinase/FAD synthetase [Xianfuyuplasma coldseepsis]QMS85864.1 bifunctional riboflavin kinase/FAD synthetase [Xianfuyuplasma coldseepsis]
MEVITLNGIKIKSNTVAAIGFFDGVHLAHKQLIETAIHIGKEHNLHTAIITFDIHPKSILYGLDYFYITPLERKLEIFKTFDIDTIYVVEFTKEKAVLKPHEFIDTYLQNIHTLVCGFDFKFGVRGSGNVKTLQEHDDFETIIVDEITYGGYKVGSTHIRDLINSGHVDQVYDVLGDYYSVRGKVVHGAKKGRMIGYPTANIDTGEYLVPKNGVYATMTKVKDRWYQSMSSIGHNPTLNCRVDVSVESNIFDFDEEIYGEVIEIKFIKRLRDELKFNSVEALIAKIDQDKLDTLDIFKDFK